MKEGRVSPYSEEIQQQRNTAASLVRDARKARDTKRQHAREAIPEEYAKELDDEANTLAERAKETLVEQQVKLGKELIEDGEYKNIVQQLREIDFEAFTAGSVEFITKVDNFLSTNRARIKLLLGSSQYLSKEDHATLARKFMQVLRSQYWKIETAHADEIDEALWHKAGDTLDEIVSENLPAIDKLITADKSTNALEALKLVAKQARSSFSLRTIQRDYAILSRHTDAIEANLITSNEGGSGALYPAQVAAEALSALSFGKAKEREIIDNIINKLQAFSGSGLARLDILGQELGNTPNSTFARDKCLELASTFIENCNNQLVKAKLLKAWSLDGEKFGDAIRQNLDAMKYLERERPGITSFLQRNYRISDFRRYPPELLIEQYEQHENVEMPYGIVVFPEADHNGAFAQDKDVLTGLHEKLQGKYLIRIFECASKQDAGRTFLELASRYNQHSSEDKKINFALIGGHGTENSIQLGGGQITNPREIINLTDLSSAGVGKIKDFFRENATIILSSCSTGTQNGIGQKLSAELDLTVIAPDTPTSLKSIEPIIDRTGSPPKFTVSYREAEAVQTYTKGLEKRNTQPETNTIPSTTTNKRRSFWSLLTNLPRSRP